MPIDSRIYLQQQGTQADIGGAFERGMRMGELYKAGQEKRQIKDAYAKNVVVGKDGKETFNRAGYLSAIGKINPEMAMEQEQKYRASDMQSLQQKRERLEAISGLVGSANDQPTWTMARQKAQEMGLDVAQIPEQFDPNIKKHIQGAALTGLQQMQLENDRLNREESRKERQYFHGVARQDRQDLQSQKREEKEQALKTPFGLANTEDDAKKLKEGFEAKRNFDNKLDQMIKLRTDAGGGAILDREAVARGKQLSKDLLLEYKNMAKLGVLSAADENIINAIIPEDPLQYNSPMAAIQGQDPTLARLKSFKADSDKDFQTRVATRTRSGVETAAKQPAGGGGPSLDALLKEKLRRSQTAKK